MILPIEEGAHDEYGRFWFVRTVSQFLREGTAVVILVSIKDNPHKFGFQVAGRRMLTVAEAIDALEDWFEAYGKSTLRKEIADTFLPELNGGKFFRTDARP